MLTGKQKRYLRSYIHSANALFQIGKEGVSYNMVTDILNYLNKHEILKISVLKNCDVPLETICNEFENYGMDIVQVIGHTIVVYKESENALEPIRFK